MPVRVSELALVGGDAADDGVAEPGLALEHVGDRFDAARGAGDEDAADERPRGAHPLDHAATGEPADQQQRDAEREQQHVETARQREPGQEAADAHEAGGADRRRDDAAVLVGAGREAALVVGAAQNSAAIQPTTMKAPEAITFSGRSPTVSKNGRKLRPSAGDDRHDHDDDGVDDRCDGAELTTTCGAAAARTRVQARRAWTCARPPTLRAWATPPGKTLGGG